MNRIVGQTPGNMAAVLDYRQEFYERWYDLRVMVAEGETPDDVAEKVQCAVTFHKKCCL